MPSVRYDRINEEIKKALSEIVRDMKDPRISPMTTILLAEATNDLKLCKVKVSVYDKDDEVRKATVAQLNRAEGFIARELGRRIDIRRIPTLKFTLDDSIEYAVHIAEIIDRLKAERAANGRSEDGDAEQDPERIGKTEE
ncbi:MAG: 30S ribosome-binding factor RbfA [Clostridia bacterium]|nr:30S ribosome-binding factor RbfA [Clostridia bacterium]